MIARGRAASWAAALLAGLAWQSPAARAGTCDSPEVLDPGAFAADIGERDFVLVAASPAGRCWVTDLVAAGQRHTPWSTFKIPHLLIALETGAARGLDERIEWSPEAHPAQDYWPADWARAQTLESAFRRSAVWYFQELVPRIGAPAYAHWLGRFSFGNARADAGNDEFWLDGTLAISPLEQLRFLDCVARSGCGASRGAVEALEAAALEREAGGLRLYGKTGAGPQRRGEMDGPFEGWFVGYVRDDRGGAWPFALFVRGPSYASIGAFRREMALRLLAAVGAWPGP